MGDAAREQVQAEKPVGVPLGAVRGGHEGGAAEDKENAAAAERDATALAGPRGRGGPPQLPEYFRKEKGRRDRRGRRLERAFEQRLDAGLAAARRPHILGSNGVTRV